MGICKLGDGELAKHDWKKIKNEYITTNISQRKLAEKYNISASTLTKRANREQWHKTSNNISNKVATKTEEKLIEKFSDKEVDRIARISSLADQLSDKLEQAIKELDRTMVTHKTKTRVIEYKNSNALSKPTKETIEEDEQLLEVSSIIDKNGLKQLTGALKDIKEIQTTISDKIQVVTEIDPLSKALQELAGEIDGN